MSSLLRLPVSVARRAAGLATTAARLAGRAVVDRLNGGERPSGAPRTPTSSPPARTAPRAPRPTESAEPPPAPPAAAPTTGPPPAPAGQDAPAPAPPARRRAAAKPSESTPKARRRATRGEPTKGQAAKRRSAARKAGTTSAGPGAEIHVGAPFEGYDKLTSAQVLERLGDMDDAQRAIVRLYEQTHRKRAAILHATAG